MPIQCSDCKNKSTKPGMLGPLCLKCKWQYPGQEAFDRKHDYYESNAPTPNEWISTDKRNPDENGRYLVCLKRTLSKKLGGRSKCSIEIIEYNNDEWKLPPPAGMHWFEGKLTCHVTHWMLLPELPENLEKIES